MIIKIFIFVFLIFICLGLISTLIKKTRVAVKSSQEHSEEQEVKSVYLDNVERYEKDGEQSGVSKDDYYYGCYILEKPVDNIDLKEAHSFVLSCELRSIGATDFGRMKSLMKELGIDDSNSPETVYQLGREITRIIEAKRS